MKKYDVKHKQLTYTFFFILAHVFITLLDVNDNNPIFDPTTYNVSVSENAINGTKLDTMAAYDIDEDRKITYTLQNDSKICTAFRINPDSGIENSNILLYLRIT